VQFQFQRQWLELRRYANERSIRIVGDIPIFVAEDSADVWANQDQFRLDGEGRAESVAGVPPDPFSVTGQIWGNPLYDWGRMRGDGFQWWKQRIRRTLQMVDVVRVDHFRGFAATWSVPAGAETAAEGHWERVPGGEVFAAIRREFGDVPVIIEDLGVITPDVVTLREILGFPGMNVLQFAFESGPSNVYLPHNHQANSVVYTATHDNQTTVGWFHSRPDAERKAIQQYIGRDGSDIAWDLIRSALASSANTSIVPLQDVLRLGDEARMNVPGKPFGNWAWRYRAEDLSHGLAIGLRELTVAYGRGGDARPNRGANPWDYTAPGSQHPALDY
jgi:4-alpha-glucanotransferase